MEDFENSASTRDSSFESNAKFRNFSRILCTKNLSKSFPDLILSTLQYWIHLFNPLITLYLVLDYIFVVLGKFYRKEKHVPLSRNLRSYLDSSDKRIRIRIGDQTMQDGIESLDYDILVNIAFQNLEDTSLIGFLKSITDNSSPISVRVRYRVKTKTIHRNYKFRKYTSARISKNFLLSNLQDLIIADLESIQKGEISNIYESHDNEALFSPFPIKTRISTSAIIPLIYKSFISKVIPFANAIPHETDWSVLITNGIGDWHPVPNPRNRYLADPHIFQNGSDVYLLVEDYDKESKKGRISMFKILEFDSISDLGIVLECQEHVSFPQTFSHNDATWMTVECFHGGGVPVYHFNTSNKSWEFFTNIMPERNFVDPIVFFHSNFWFLIATEKTNFGEDYYSKLVIYYCTEPFENNWKTLSNTVLAFDCSIGRNAGLIRTKNHLIRVAQEHIEGIYGKSITFQRIDSISDRAYSESTIHVDFPALPSKLSRCHTYSQLQNFIAVDAKFVIE